MKVGFIHCVVISVILAVAGYFVLSFSDMNMSLPLSVAASLLISGIVTPWLASLLSRTPDSQEDPDVVANETATLYVGNLPYKANEEAVKDYFKGYINVQSVRLMKDRRTGKRKGYGFIEVLTDDVDSAISELNDKVFLERTLKVRHAKEKGETEQ